MNAVGKSFLNCNQDCGGDDIYWDVEQAQNVYVVRIMALKYIVRADKRRRCCEFAEYFFWVLLKFVSGWKER